MTAASASGITQRIVLVCRRRADATLAEYVARARGLVLAADVTGGSLAAWASSFFALSWEASAISAALEIASALREEGNAWSCAMAVGNVEHLDADANDLILGEALAAAEGLAAASKAGQAWAHASILAMHGAKLRATTLVAMAWGGREFQGALLDLRPPKTSSPSIRPAPAAPIVAAPAVALTAATPIAPEVRYRSPSTFDVEEVDPEALAARLAQLSRDALLDGDAQSLERWSDGLKATGEKDALAERMRAMARLARGRVGDALRALRDARKYAEEDGTPEARCQASLALGVGLAFAGRVDDALLEGMDALARAREAGDAQAEQACLAFLQRLFSGRRPSVFPPTAAVAQKPA
ncbi:MAG TPA: hypothetical protein VHZ95_14470 [Polyangiales bacterium]|jgi:hypothetical protein|nr:hypothetical protein [Polyangiales bacterium]